MKRMMDVFSAWPSDADLGRDIGMPYSTVSAWKQRGSIPAAYWRDIIRAARRRGHPEITADLLVDLHARVPGKELAGLAEEERPFAAQDADAKADGDRERTGHFSRFKTLRRPHFASLEEVNAHVGALRDEWERR
jgi:hypothetical protein